MSSTGQVPGGQASVRSCETSARPIRLRTRFLSSRRAPRGCCATPSPGLRTRMMLAWQLAKGRHQPGLTAASLLAGQPSWLSDGGGDFEVAIGSYASDHGHPDIARSAFERAATYDRADRDRLLSIAALLAASQDDLQGAEANLAQTADADSLFPRLARAAISDHAGPAGASESSEARQLLQDAEPTELAGEPTILSLLATLAASNGDLAEALRQLEFAAAA